MYAEVFHNQTIQTSPHHESCGSLTVLLRPRCLGLHAQRADSRPCIAGFTVPAFKRITQVSPCSTLLCDYRWHPITCEFFRRAGCPLTSFKTCYPDLAFSRHEANGVHAGLQRSWNMSCLEQRCFCSLLSPIRQFSMEWRQSPSPQGQSCHA